MRSCRDVSRSERGQDHRRRRGWVVREFVALALRSRVTLALVAVNVGIYVLDGMAPGLHLWERLSGDIAQVKDGELFRLFTCAFVHANRDHLIWNMLPLSAWGMMVETSLGRWRLAVLYLAAALCGSITVLLLAPADAVMVGSSGAVYGVAGAWVIVTRRHLRLKGRDPVVSVMVAIMLVLALLALPLQRPRENAAHAAGSITGVVLAMAWRPARVRRS